MGLFSLFRRDKKRIANESFCETSDKTDAHEATREHLPPRQVKKRKLTDGETDSTKIASGALYSSDIIFHILGFFVSDSGSQGEIDGTSLKNAMLVCHQWKKVANSKALWSLPTRAFPSITDSTKRSLLLRDTSFDENSNSVSASPSNARLPLIGFQKLSSEKAKFGDEATIFRARNRATGEVNLLSISPRSKKTSEMLNQVFEAHFFQHSSFCGGDGLTAAFMPKSFPRGVATINGRVTRWYEASKNAEIFPNPVFTSHLKSFRNGWEEIHGDDSDTNDFMGKRFRLCYCFDHLKKVEQDVAADENSEAPNLVCWSMVVDWVIEIMQCFDLEDRIAFHTMALFQQFMTKTDGKIKPINFQLVASACMLIASKCNMQQMKEVDFTRCSDNMFSTDILRKMEEIVLETLRWRLALPNILEFVFSYVQILGIESNSRELMMIRYLSETALQSQIQLQYKPSLVAAAVVALARYTLDERKPLWSKDLETRTGYSHADVYGCITALCSSIDTIRQRVSLRVIRRRYLQPQWKSVGNVAIPSHLSTVTLEAYQRQTIE